MTRLEHFKRWAATHHPLFKQESEEFEGRTIFFNHRLHLMWQAWQASPKTLPTEKSRITKEQLDALRADTTNIVDHLRGIYPSAVSPYPVSPLQKRAADFIEGLQEEIKRLEGGTID